MKDIVVCDYHKSNNEPCYGELVSFFDNGHTVTTCKGHRACPDGGFYIPEDPIRRWIFSQQNQRIRDLQAENELLREMVNYADAKLVLTESKNEIEIPPERLEILNA